MRSVSAWIRDVALSTCLAAAAAAVSSQGQSPAPDSNQPRRPQIFRGAVNLVYVDAYPRRNGKLVDDLLADDFQILEDGKPQTVQAFEFIRIGSNSPDTDRRDPNTKEEGERLAADPHNRVFIIYLDLYHTTFSGAHYTREPLLRFLNRTIAANDLFAVLTPEAPARQLVLGRRIDTLESELTKHFDWGLQDRPISPRTPEEEELFATCGSDYLIRVRREDLLATSLEDLMVYLRDLRDERKNVLVVSEGWVPRPPRPVVPGGQIAPPRIGPGPTGRLGIGVPEAGAPNNASWCDSEAMRLTSIDFQQRFRDLLSLAGRANVSFYPVDVGGLKTEPGFTAELRQAPSPQQLAALHDEARAKIDTLRELAENTDGRAVLNTNDLEGGFRQVADDLSAYYLLGYASSNVGLDGKFHRIEVKVNKPGVRVAARKGYVAPEPAPVPGPTIPPTSTEMIDAMKRFANLRSEGEMFSYGVRTAAGIDIVAEIASSQIDRGRWKQGADVEVSVSGAGASPLTAIASIDPGRRSVVVSIPVTEGGNGPWQANVRLGRGDDRADDRVEIRRPPGKLLGSPVCHRGTTSARVALQPVADFQFRRTERVHVEWPITSPLDQRTARLLDRRAQPMLTPVTVAEREGNGGLVVTTDVLLAALAAGDYAVELQVGRGPDTERALVGFRVVR